MGSLYQTLCNLFWTVSKYIAGKLPIPDSTPPTGPQSPSKDNIAKIILEYNNGLSFWPGGITKWTVPSKGVILNKIDQTSANISATYLEDGAKKYGFNLYFAMGCIAIESAFDLLCQNGNLAGSNPSNNPMGYDMGPCQLKLEDIVAPGVSGYATAYAFALDPSKCYPYFFSLMAGKLEWAKKIIAENTSSNPDQRFNKYPELLATGAYNFGNTGVYEDYYVKGIWPSHCQQVWDLANSFAIKDGKEPIFT